MITLRIGSAAIFVAGALALAACGGGNTTSSSPTTAPTMATATTTETAIGGGSAACTQAGIEAAVTAYAKAGNEDAVLATGGGKPYQCADGWAVGFVNVGPEAVAATTTVVWQAEGPYWVPQDRAKICPKPSPVPKAIYKLACNTN